MRVKVLAGSFFCSALLFSAPLIREIHPHGAQKGSVVELSLRGDGLKADSKVQTSIPGVVSRLVTKTAGEMAVLVEISKDARPGLYPLRVINEDGLSNVMLFAVGMFTEVEEKEVEHPKPGNGTLETAEAIPVPVIVNGTLTAADIDIYSFNAKAGEKLVFEVEARRAGSAIDPHVEVLDAAGKMMAQNDDAAGLGVDSRVEVKFAKAGSYRVRVRDSRYSDQVQNFYRLKIGSFAFADGIFPLGGRRGEAVEVSFGGGNLSAPVKVSEKLSGSGLFQEVALPGSAALPMVLAIGDKPEEMEQAGSAMLKPDVIMNGRISKPGEIDKFTLAVKPGEQWVLELTAAVLGTSQLDAILTVLDAKGKKLFTRDDINTPDPTLPFTVPEGVQEVTVAVEDVLGRGGPSFGYRLEARRHAPDFVAEIVTPFVNVPVGGTASVAVQIQRRGYDGPIRLGIPNLPPGFVVAGGHVPSEAAAQSPFTEGAGFRGARTILTITAPPDAKAQNLELQVVADGGGIERSAAGLGMVTPVRGDKQKPQSAQWLGMQLPMAVARALPVNLTVPVPAVRLAQGFEYPMQYTAAVKPGGKLMGKVNNQMVGAIGNMRILAGPPGKNPDSGSVLVATNFSSPITTFDMVFESQTEVDGRMVPITSPAVSVEIVPGYTVGLESTAFAVMPGKKMEFHGTVRREPTFEGSTVRVKAEDLPDNVKCGAADLAADQTAFVVSCEASAEAVPGDYDIRVTSVAPNVGRKQKADYKISDIDAKLKIGKTERAA
ncbi:MAG: PPC domain-containing protein, partial [Bryobacteraceae bacterium]